MVFVLIHCRQMFSSHNCSFSLMAVISINSYCKFGNFGEGFIFAKLRMRNSKINLSFTDISK